MADVPAVDTAVRLTERISREWPNAITAGVLVEELGLNRSTCYSILRTLERAGWAATRGDGRGWWPGPRLLGLADDRREDATAALVLPELDELSRTFGQLAFAARRDGDGWTVLARSLPPRGARLTVDVGDTVAASPALVDVDLAWSAPQDGAEAARRTRTRGFSEARDPRTGLNAVCAPVLDHRGRVAMVLCVYGQPSALTDQALRSTGARVRDAGRRLGERLQARSALGNDLSRHAVPRTRTAG
ncbi:MAG: hypothetical protein ABS81_03585 [Pseudonocardia sp. SCN 72-86]|nr:MAG: hypothetical protein ABS81_03585 [Pseudonocardia sp. SCN 72-86]